MPQPGHEIPENHLMMQGNWKIVAMIQYTANAEEMTRISRIRLRFHLEFNGQSLLSLILTLAGFALSFYLGDIHRNNARIRGWIENRKRG